MTHVGRVLLLVALLVLAGCASPFGGAGGGTDTTGETPTPTATATPTPTPTAAPTTATSTPTTTTLDDGSTVEVSGPLGVDADAAWERVQSLLGTDVAPPRVTVVVATATPPGHAGERFGETLGIGDASLADPASVVRGTTRVEDGRGNVTLIVGHEATRAAVERVLVREYVVAVQQQAGWAATRDRALTERLPLSRYFTADTTFARESLREGAAAYVAGVYADRYLDGAGGASLAERYGAADPGTKLALAPAFFGSQYVAARVDSPADLASVYAGPPYTAEQVVHGYRPEEEPTTALSVQPAGGADWPVVVDTTGELFVRTALSVELSETRAAAAAAGWGDDRLYAFDDDQGHRGYVWVLDWDDAAEADEFAAAFETYVDRRPSDTRFGVRRVAPTTVAVVAGPDVFVLNSRVRVEGGDVVVAPGW